MTSRSRILHVRATGCLVSGVAFGASLCGGYGCAALSRDLQKECAVRLEPAPSDIASVSHLRVYEDDGDLVVYGKVGRKAGVKGRIEASVRVLVQFPNGRVLEATKRAFPPYLPIRRSRKSNFTVRFDGLPPAGTIVRIECPPSTPSTAPASSPVARLNYKELLL